MAEGMVMVAMLCKEDCMSLYVGRNMVSSIVEVLVMAVRGNDVLVDLALMVGNAVGIGEGGAVGILIVWPRSR